MADPQNLKQADQAERDAHEAWLAARKRVRELVDAHAHPFEIAAAHQEVERCEAVWYEALEAYGEAQAAKQDCHSMPITTCEGMDPDA